MSIPRNVTLSGGAGSFAVALGPTMPTLSSGYGGWNEVPRPRRMSMTEWMGPDTRKASLQLLFDGFADGTSVQADVDALLKAYAPADGSKEPPPLTVAGAWPIPSTVKWVVQDAAWDEWVRDSAGSPTRVLMTLTLWQYVAPDPVAGKNTAAQRSTSAKAPAAKPAAKAKTYVIKKGDTLSEIAAKLLGDWKRYPEIAKLNGIRDPNKILAGNTLRLP